MSYNMSIIKNDNNINEININNKKIASIYYGNILVYSSLNNIEIVFRDIDKNGNLTLATGNLTGYFDDIEIIGSSGLYYAFNGCIGITGSINFPNLTSIESSGLYYAFNGCIGITSVSFPNLTTIENDGLYFAFDGCTGITGSISFPNLITIENRGLYFAFQGCTGITSVSFPSLTFIGSNGLQYAFNICTGITEIHFRADAKNIVESTDGYSSKFGASNATIYFDL